MPPGPFVQKLNATLHQEPWATLAYGCFWSLVLILSCPLVVSVLLGRMLSQLLIWCFWPAAATAYDPSHVADDVELAVVITGCDTGFGKDLALRAADLGYTVFAGCLDPKVSWEVPKTGLLTKGTVIPLPMDVTRDDQVNAAVASMTKWLKETNTGEKSKEATVTKKRVLHALVNNAGIGVGGLVDWTDISYFQRCIDVNYIGMVRVCKAFLPILKEQAVQRVHAGAMRIFNMTSMAGLVASGLAGFSAYCGSKHAANAFSSVLRGELRGFGIQVTTINPSFHGTALVNDMGDKLVQVWSELDAAKKAEYGEGTFGLVWEHPNKANNVTIDLQSLSMTAYFNRLKFISVGVPHLVTWDAEVVVDEVIKSLKAKHSPADLLIGSDAHFSLPFLRMLPSWFLDALLILNAPSIPAAMKKSWSQNNFEQPTTRGVKRKNTVKHVPDKCID